jgi:hypothetical protein
VVGSYDGMPIGFSDYSGLSILTKDSTSHRGVGTIMQDDLVRAEPQTIFDEAVLRPGVCFDPDEVVLEGLYADELSAYRAKKVWVRALESNFLLETKHDFSIRVLASDKGSMFKLRCDFMTACGRYAFWRLTHNQAPETQYLIETAHIPASESHSLDLAVAPDMQEVRYSPRVLSGPHEGDIQEGGLTGRILSWFSRIMKKRL